MINKSVLKQTSKSTVYPLSIPCIVIGFNKSIVPLRNKSDIMFYITINRCIITIRINTALIDYLANIGNSIGLIKTQSVSLSQNIYNNFIANCKKYNFDPPFTTPCQGRQ